MSEKEGTLSGMPEGWARAELGEICDLINGRAFKPSEWSSKGLPIIRIQNLNDKEASFNYCDFQVKDKYLVDDGQLLFAWSGTPETSFGAHIWNRGRAVLNQHIFKVEIDENRFNKLFLKYLINYKVSEYIQKAHGTAGLAHITKSKFEKSLISIPPYSEQRRIVVKLEELFSKLDAATRSLQRTKVQVERYRQSVLRDAFKGKLTGAWKNDYGQRLEPKSVRDLKETRITVLNSDLSELPREWMWKSLGEIADINPGIPEELIVGNMKVSFIPMRNVEEETGKIDISIIRKYEDVKKGYTRFIDGDIIFAKITPCMENGKIAIVRGLLNKTGLGSTEFHVIRLKRDNFSKEFYFYYLVQKRFRQVAEQYMTGTVGHKRVPTDYMREVIVPVPSIEEQHLIVNEIESRFSVIGQIEKEVDQSLAQSERLRQSILRQAFDGKLVPQDPSDEPAPELLKRMEKRKTNLKKNQKQRRLDKW